MAHRFNGVDVNREISLFEYGFLAKKHTKDYSDEYFIIYKINEDAFGTGYKQESELDALINGEEWADEKEVKEFLKTCGVSKEEWLEMPFVNKLSDCLMYWDYLNIIGEDYSPMTEAEIYMRYKHLF
jgi:hypothetical protein